jgi:hypothetical protein
VKACVKEIFNKGKIMSIQVPSTCSDNVSYWNHAMNIVKEPCMVIASLETTYNLRREGL